MDRLKRVCESPRFILGYLALGLVIVWSPMPVTDLVGPVLTGFDSVLENAFGLPPGLGLNALEFVANIVLFIPPAIFFGLRVAPYNWSIVVVAGIICSVAVETFQLAFLPGRSATVQDVIANSLGALIGALIAARMHR